MKIYLAAKFALKGKMQGVRDFLAGHGHEITAQWIDVEPESDDDSGGATDEIRLKYAKLDIEDVLRSDVLVAFSNLRGELGTGGGRHVEFGIALHAGKRIIVVGPKGEHIFHYIPGIEFVDSVDALVEQLQKGKTHEIA